MSAQLLKTDWRGFLLERDGWGRTRRQRWRMAAGVVLWFAVCWPLLWIQHKILRRQKQ